MEKGTVWIIGGSSGLGLATAEAFAADGWFVISGARSFGASAQNGAVREFRLDVTDGESRSAFVREAFALRSRVDVLVYCAAILILSPCELTSYDEYARVMQTNFLGMTDFVGRVLPALRAQKSGKIVLFSSINGLLGIPFQSAYVASKHAVEGYAECLALECERLGRTGFPGRAGRPPRRQPALPAFRICRRRLAVSARLSPPSLPRSAGREPWSIPGKPGRKVVRNVNRSRMRFRLRIAKAEQKAGVILHDTLSFRLNMRILDSYYRKKG